MTQHGRCQLLYVLLPPGGVHRVPQSESEHRDGPERAARYHQDHRSVCSDLAHRQRVHHRAQLSHRREAQAGGSCLTAPSV